MTGAPEIVTGAPETVTGAPETVTGAFETVTETPETVTGVFETVTGTPETVTLRPGTGGRLAPDHERPFGTLCRRKVGTWTARMGGWVRRVILEHRRRWVGYTRVQTGRNKNPCEQKMRRTEGILGDGMDMKVVTAKLWSCGVG